MASVEVALTLRADVHQNPAGKFGRMVGIIPYPCRPSMNGASTGASGGHRRGLPNGIPGTHVAIPNSATTLLTWRRNRSLTRLRFGTSKKSRNAIGSAKKVRRSNSSPRR